MLLPDKPDIILKALRLDSGITLGGIDSSKTVQIKYSTYCSQDRIYRLSNAAESKICSGLLFKTGSDKPLF